MNKEFYEDARKVAESCSKERLVELYLAEVQTCCEVEEYKEIADNTIEMYAEKCKVLQKALELACETLQDINFKLYNTEMNFVDFFKQQAKEMLEKC